MPNYKTTPWSGVASAATFPALSQDLTVDVAIVGGGITGVTVAHLLKSSGLSVALLESRRLGAGETKRTTAHLTEVLDARLRRLKANFGVDGARLAVRGQRAAIELVTRLVGELGLSCQLERVPGYLYAEKPEEAKELQAEAEAARELGLHPSVTEEAPLPFPVLKALRFDDQAQLHPRAYLEGLVAGLAPGGRAIEGCAIHETTHVTHIEDGEPCRVTTDRGIVTARSVIVASGVPISDRYLLHPKLAAYRTYVLAAPTPTPLRGLFWDMKEPYHYLRGHELPGASYVIVGGEDHKVGDETDTNEAYARLEAWTQSHLGLTVAPADFRWSGQIIEPVDGLPLIGRDARSKHVFVATGYSGNGMTGGTLAALILSQQVRGLATPWDTLLAPTRIKPFASARAFLRENVDFPKHLVTDRLPVHQPGQEDAGLDHIPPGEGGVVSVGGEKLAVYRDGEGNLSAVSAVCTHLGCCVRWNKSESSWDCPCHGSRFDTTGRVLNGPALHPLETKPLPGPAPAPEIRPPLGGRRAPRA
jgi:glycine/D-amino acid oxidase-like deaminating enzyme/nitrite reductase/ring-hydroxylating ferredoxin subunit